MKSILRSATARAASTRYFARLVPAWTLGAVSFAAAAGLSLSGCGGGASDGGGTGGEGNNTSYTVGGTLSGVTGAGLVLQDNDRDNLSVTTSGTFVFATGLPSNSAYSVTVLTQPTGQSCSVINGSGTIGSADVTSVAINCHANPTQLTYSIGGTVSDLTGSGLVLQDNNSENLSISQDGSFAFNTQLSTGAVYTVTVHSQPSNETCSVTNGHGAVGSTNVTNVLVNCVPIQLYSVGGTVFGMTGSGLVLQDDGGANLPVSGNGTFDFPAKLTTGASYSVTVLTQPSGQSCTVTNGNGTVADANVTNIAINCNAPLAYTIGAKVMGLAVRGSGLVLMNNGTDSLAIPWNTTWNFAQALQSGSTYSVSVASQPGGQICVVMNGQGTVAGANVTNVTVNCSFLAQLKCDTLTVGGSGLEELWVATSKVFDSNNSAGPVSPTVEASWVAQSDGFCANYPCITGTLEGQLWAYQNELVPSLDTLNAVGFLIATVPAQFQPGPGAYSPTRLVWGGEGTSNPVASTGINPPPGQYCLAFVLAEYQTPGSCAYQPGGFCAVAAQQVTLGTATGSAVFVNSPVSH